jgi:hypothetical protein
MTAEQFAREKSYQAALAVLLRMRGAGLLSDEELASAERYLWRKHRPPIGVLYPLSP